MARKRRKMTITQLYNRTAKGLSYFGEVIPEKKRATRKQLKEIQKIWKNIRKAEREKGITDLPTIAQAAKYVEEEEQQPKEVKEPLPYAQEDEITMEENIRSSEDVINEFLEAMQTALSEATLIYGLSQPYVARALEKQFTALLATFNEARAIKGDDYVAEYLLNNLDFQRLYDMVYSDSEGRADAIHDVDQVISGILNNL